VPEGHEDKQVFPYKLYSASHDKQLVPVVEQVKHGLVQATHKLLDDEYVPTGQVP
jgi:hypothetical protein